MQKVVLMLVVMLSDLTNFVLFMFHILSHKSTLKINELLLEELEEFGIRDFKKNQQFLLKLLGFLASDHLRSSGL